MTEQKPTPEPWSGDYIHPEGLLPIIHDNAASVLSDILTELTVGDVIDYKAQLLHEIERKLQIINLITRELEVRHDNRGGRGR